jgi:DNA-binding GntR family transcriptional regulator
MSKLSSGKDTLHVKAYQEITNNTICLRPEPRERISEDETATYLKISRILVREALLILENKKYCPNFAS